MFTARFFKGLVLWTTYQNNKFHLHIGTQVHPMYRYKMQHEYRTVWYLFHSHYIVDLSPVVGTCYTFSLLWNLQNYE